MDYEEVLITKIAWYYYMGNMTQQQIADVLGTSRVRVNKLLDKARSEGIVQFKIRNDSAQRIEIEKNLVKKYSLTDAFTVPSIPGDNNGMDQIAENIARGAASYIADRITQDIFINFGYGNTIGKLINHLAMISEHPFSCVSLTGGVNYYLPNTTSSTFNAKLYLMPMPLIASSKEMADAMRKERSVTEINKMLPHSILTVVGIGSMAETATVLKEQTLTKHDFLIMRMNGAVGDVLSHFMDKDGNLISSPIEDRLISTPLSTLKSLRNVIGVAGGDEKIQAIKAALLGGYIDILITDEETAVELLELD